MGTEEDFTQVFHLVYGMCHGDNTIPNFWSWMRWLIDWYYQYISTKCDTCVLRVVNSHTSLGVTDTKYTLEANNESTSFVAFVYSVSYNVHCTGNYQIIESWFIQWNVTKPKAAQTLVQSARYTISVLNIYM